MPLALVTVHNTIWGPDQQPAEGVEVVIDIPPEVGGGRGFVSTTAEVVAPTVLVTDGARPGAAAFRAGWGRVVPPAAPSEEGDTPFDRLLSAADAVLDIGPRCKAISVNVTNQHAAHLRLGRRFAVGVDLIEDGLAEDNLVSRFADSSDRWKITDL